jgi:hypothetical protein
MADILSAGKEVFALVCPDQHKKGPVSFDLSDIRQRLRAAGAPVGSIKAMRHLEQMTPNMLAKHKKIHISRFVYETIKRWSPSCIDCKVDLRSFEPREIHLAHKRGQDKPYNKPSHTNRRFVEVMISNPWSLCEVSCAACNDT